MRFRFKTIDKSALAKNATAVVAIDLNMPVVNGRVADDFRLKRSIPTLSLLARSGTHTLLLGHLARGEDDTISLAPVCRHLNNFFPARFAKDIVEARKALAESKNGEFVMLENTRRFTGEKENDESFARELASLGNIYVNEAFSVSHRPHASIVGVPKFLPHYAGSLFSEEVAHLARAFNPSRPFLFILAGAKFETKMPLVKKFIELADLVFVGGALANDLFRAKGYEVGLSKHAERDLGFADLVKNKKLTFPSDVTIASGAVKNPDRVLPSERIVDAGPATVAALSEKITQAKFALWNGTLGEYESGFGKETEALAKILAESSTESVVGGGDTLAAIAKLNLTEKFSFVSTGGGAMLEFLAKGTLPGIEALEN
ncbi:phosphoglycerate kinase [Patescibacteria group bacterium]|nr:phosphoglycerate kinase [Patescibacteria group bacterium]